MGRIIRTQLAEAIVGLIISALLAHFGELAAFTGLTGTSVVMAVTALAARSARAVLIVVALVAPLASVTALETSLDTSLTAIAHGPSDGGTTVQAVYDKYRAKVSASSDDTPIPTPTPPSGSRTIDPNAGAEVSPAALELSCPGEECGKEVTISSTGTAALRLTSMTFEGAGAAAWHRSDDCEDEVIAPEQDCRLKVWVVRGDESDEPGESTAQLVIHQNTPGPASRVALTTSGSPTPTITDPPQEATLSGAGSTGIDPADCSALDGSVTVLAAGAAVEWTAALGGTTDAPGSEALSGVIVDPPSGSVPAGESRTIAVRGAYTGTDGGFGLSIRYADESVDFRVGC
ncbi:hypothetical protein [Streptomyces sp. NPDC058751]|uniref:hypothetical protein n=1 Tax=Streptomyces sp. NPDC058751 TaxID=3346623 RepID=UPI0036A6661F